MSKTSVLAIWTTLAIGAFGAIGSIGAALALASNGRGARDAAARRPTLRLHKGRPGTFIADSRGRALYLFERDRGPKSTCYGACAQVWAPYRAPRQPTAGTGVAASKLGATKRKDGSRQVTYGGHPLYHYAGDRAPGQTSGQDLLEFGAKWFVVAASGRKIAPN